MRQYHVYALVRPDEFRPFYIGVTRLIGQRSGNHRAKYGADILFTVLATFENWEEARRVETETIDFYRQRGVVLCNHDSYKPYSPKRLERIKAVPGAGVVYKPKRKPLDQRAIEHKLCQLSEELALLSPSEVSRCMSSFEQVG